jgi:hypothetical protein
MNLDVKSMASEDFEPFFWFKASGWFGTTEDCSNFGKF